MSPRLALQRLIARVFGWRISHPLIAMISRLLVPRHRVGVLLVVFNDEDELLLLRHVFHTTSQWGLPGGWLQRGEAPQEGAARELREETGLEATVGPVVLLSREPEPPHIPIVFVARVKPGRLRLSFESSDARWCSADDLPEPLDPFIRQAIRQARRWREGAQGDVAPTGSG